MGYDVHPLEEGRELWLGGLLVPSTRGAVGHSDADVLLHAICDALLGAANLGDIGQHFPNTDARWKNKDSKYFLKVVVDLLRQHGWQVENLDCTLCLEHPKIGPHIPAMRQVLAPLLGTAPEVISIKATTSERLGYVGRQEGVNAYAVVLISKA